MRELRDCLTQTISHRFELRPCWSAPTRLHGDHLQIDTILSQPYMRAAVQKELAAALEEAKRILVLHGQALKEVAARLRTNGRIDGYEVERIIGSLTETSHVTRK